MRHGTGLEVTILEDNGFGMVTVAALFLCLLDGGTPTSLTTAAEERTVSASTTQGDGTIVNVTVQDHLCVRRGLKIMRTDCTLPFENKQKYY